MSVMEFYAGSVRPRILSENSSKLKAESSRLKVKEAVIFAGSQTPVWEL